MKQETRTGRLWMKKYLVGCLGIAVLAFTALLIPSSNPTPAVAQVGKGLSGPHYNLNIIGVPKGKNPDMTNTNGHTIFLPLTGTTKIYYVAGDEFQVLDRNGTDADGATVEVPSSPGETTTCYSVYATALGKPFGNAIVNADCVIDGLIGPCTDALLMDSFEVTRDRGKPRRENISDIFRATGCIDLNSTGVCDQGDLQFNNVWIFNLLQLESYFWDYNNTDLRLMQVRFYPVEGGCGTISTVQ
jgi:hypothetical protein